MCCNDPRYVYMQAMAFPVYLVGYLWGCLFYNMSDIAVFIVEYKFPGYGYGHIMENLIFLVYSNTPMRPMMKSYSVCMDAVLSVARPDAV